MIRVLNIPGKCVFGCGLSLSIPLHSARAETVLYNFQGFPGDGQYPFAGLIRDSEGNLYGTTYGGGAYRYGTVFKLAPDGTETVLYDFAPGYNLNPIAGLIADKKGYLYGTTVYGGTGSCAGSGCGVVFSLKE